MLAVHALPLTLAAMPTARRGLRVVATGLTDAELVDRARGGDDSAVEAIYKRHVAYVAGIALRILRSRTETEDLVQETFIAVFAHLDSVRDGDALRAYLAQTIVRACGRRIRRRRLARLFSLDTPEDDVSLDSMASDDASPETRAELALLDRVLRRLDTDFRIAWTLRLVEGLALDEVAAACGCSLATAKRRIAAADAEIRRHVQLSGEPS